MVLLYICIPVESEREEASEMVIDQELKEGTKTGLRPQYFAQLTGIHTCHAGCVMHVKFDCA